MQRQLRRLCGGDHIVPFRILLKQEYACFGVRDIGFLASGTFDLPKELTPNEIILPETCVDGQFKICSMYEATEQGGKLVLLRLSATLTHFIRELVSKHPTHVENGHLIRRAFCMKDSSSRPAILPSGRTLNTLIVMHDESNL